MTTGWSSVTVSAAPAGNPTSCPFMPEAIAVPTAAPTADPTAAVFDLPPRSLPRTGPPAAPPPTREPNESGAGCPSRKLHPRREKWKKPPPRYGFDARSGGATRPRAADRARGRDPPTRVLRIRPRFKRRAVRLLGGRGGAGHRATERRRRVLCPGVLPPWGQGYSHQERAEAGTRCSSGRTPGGSREGASHSRR